MSDTTKGSDALTIARWCWPELPWLLDGDAHGDPSFVYALTCSDPRHSDKWDEHARSFEDWPDVHDAERVLIERGHARRYGVALCYAVFSTPEERGEEEWDLATTCVVYELYNGEDFARLATAPLDARVRAMAAVIRGLGA